MKWLGKLYLLRVKQEAEKETREHMTKCLEEGKACKTLLTNYTKDGTPFRNLLSLFPVYKSGEICYYIGIQCNVSDPATPYQSIMLVDDLMSIIPKIIDEEKTEINRHFENLIESIGICKYIDQQDRPKQPSKLANIIISRRLRYSKFIERPPPSIEKLNERLEFEEPISTKML